MITTMIHSHAERLHSYELIAETMAVATSTTREFGSPVRNAT